MTPFVQHLATRAHQVGGRATVVGGAVRDRLLGIEPKDIDIEVFGIAEAAVESFLRNSGAHVVRCGRSFPVWKAWTDNMGRGEAVDVALPRREVKTGSRHTDFDAILDPAMTFAAAAARRDFTINAIGWDPLTGEYLDPHGGQADLERKHLRHVSPQFAEDPLRVLRGAQFCARFGLTAAPATVGLCRTLSPDQLSSERLLEEWRKLLLKGAKPSLGLAFLRAAAWTSHFPELHALIGVPQDPAWHPEGDVWQHTLHCVDAFASRRTGDPATDVRVGFAVLCHDFGKPATTALLDGRWRALGHEEAGEGPTRSFLGRLTAEQNIINDVVPLVTHHMVPKDLFRHATQGEKMFRAVRRLSTRVRLDHLAMVCWCDDAGRPPKPAVSPASDWLRAESERLGVAQNMPAPLIRGRDLLELGFQPGAHWGPVLRDVFEKQLNGEVTDPQAALAYATRELKAAGHGCHPDASPSSA